MRRHTSWTWSRRNRDTRRYVIHRPFRMACGHWGSVDADDRLFQHDPAWCPHCQRLTMVVWS